MPTPANSITVKILDVITDSMKEIGVLAAGETAPIDQTADVLKKLQRLIDRYNAREVMVYNVNFSTYTIPANSNPVTIGPGGVIDINQRPVDILSMALFLNSNSIPVKLTLNKRDQQWWAAQTIPSLTSSVTTDFYYSPDWPLGNIYLWPIDTVTADFQLQSRLVLTEATSYSQDFTMPPGYWDLIVYDLADSIAEMFGRSSTPDLLRKLGIARKAVQVNNMQSPRLSSDAPSSRGNNEARPDFNFLTGLSQ